MRALGALRTLQTRGYRREQGDGARLPVAVVLTSVCENTRTSWPTVHRLRRAPPHGRTRSFSRQLDGYWLLHTAIDTHTAADRSPESNVRWRPPAPRGTTLRLFWPAHGARSPQCTGGRGVCNGRCTARHRASFSHVFMCGPWPVRCIEHSGQCELLTRSAPHRSSSLARTTAGRAWLTASDGAAHAPHF